MGTKGIQIVSSLDSEFAIAETIGKKLRGASKLYICSPWIERSFVHFMQMTVPRHANVNMLIRTPEEHNRTFKAVEALESISKKMSWQLDIMCVPELHAKFMIINNTDVLFGTLNATNSGLFHNFEVLVAFNDMPTITEQFLKIYKKFRAHEHNLHWNLVKEFHGPTIDRKAAYIIIRYLQQRPYLEAPLHSLALQLRKNGYGRSRAESKIKELYQLGVIIITNDGRAKLNEKYADL